MLRSTASILFLLLLLAATKVNASGCEIEVSVTLDRRLSLTHVVHEFTQLKSNPAIQVVSTSNVLPILLPVIYSVSGNRLTLQSLSRVTFLVRGQDANCVPPVVVNVAQVPLDAATDVPPNILLIVDNSNKMVENVNGAVAASCEPGPNASCIAGSASPLSKSEIIRGVARRLVTDYSDLVNLGLMAYQQYPVTTQTGSDLTHNVTQWWLVNRFYDVSYNPANYQGNTACSFGLQDWDRSGKCFRQANPSSSGNFVHYNIRVPGYSQSQPDGVSYFTIDNPAGDLYKTEPFLFNCFRSKTGTSDTIPTSAGGNGYSNNCGTTTGRLNDSARARGVTHWGQRMISMSFNRQEWISTGSPGLGYLHVPIARLNQNHANRLNTKLRTVDYTYSTNKATNASDPLINAGLAPLEGTLYTARDYFLNRQGNFGNSQGRSNAVYPLPESCEVNAAIWLTDGLPSVDRQGNALGRDVAKALSDAVTAADSLHREAGVDLYVVGFATPPTVSADSLDQLARAGGTARSFMATDTAGLDAAMRGIFEDVIQQGRQTATSAAFNTSRFGSNTLFYLSGYLPEDWSGELSARNARTGSSVWNANRRLLDATGTSGHYVFTYNRESGRGVPLVANQLAAAAQDALNRNPVSNAVDNLASARIQWLRGLEQTGLRSRQAPEGRRLLGSIVHSTPVYSGRASYRGQDRLPGNEGTRFWTYFNQYPNRELLIAAANDGKLHGFDAVNGTHYFSYLPASFLYPRVANRAAEINALMAPDYSHRYYMNGEVQVADAYFGNQWQRVLVATQGQGGRSVVALNLSKIISRIGTNDLASEAVLWEFEHPELGEGVRSVDIVRLANGRWAAVFGNGFNTTSNRSGLFLVDIETGSLIRFIQTSEGSAAQPNGITSMRSLLATDANMITNWVYAGDQQGHVWRFDLRNATATNWSVARLFSAVNASNQRQPITARPELVRFAQRPGEVLVAFGTGSFFRGSGQDINNRDTQSFYVIFDNQQRTGVNRSQLLRQSIEWQRSATHAGTTYRMRGTSRNQPAANQLGWYIDLDMIAGERVVSAPSISGGGIGKRIRFNTLVVDTPDSICEPPSRSGFLFELSLLTGGSVGDSRFVLQDGQDLASLLGSGFSPSAIGHNQGQSATVVLETGGDMDILVSADGAMIQAISDVQHRGRRSWEQLK